MGISSKGQLETRVRVVPKMRVRPWRLLRSSCDDNEGFRVPSATIQDV